MEDRHPRASTRNRILTVTGVVLTVALGVAGYIFLYHPPLKWEEHLEIFDDTWGIADPSYRNWTAKVKNIGPYPIRSAEVILELKDASGNTRYTGSKTIVEPSDPPMHPGNVKRFSIVLKYTKPENIDDNQTIYRIDIHAYEKIWF